MTQRKLVQSAPAFVKEHDHAVCIKDAMAQVKVLCQQRAVKLTTLRERVLSVVWQAHRPIGAYDILAELSVDQKPVAPPTVYRALDFLLAQGFIHRINSLNAYLGCVAPDLRHSGQFLICTCCRLVQELHQPRVNTTILDAAADCHFQVAQQIVEISGLCQRCQSHNATPEAKDDIA